MPAPVVIQFVTTGLPQIVQQLKAAGKQAQQTAAQVSQSAQKAAAVGGASLPAAASTPSSGATAGSAPSRLPRSVSNPTFASGPNQRLAKLRQQLPAAVASGNTNAASDIQLAMSRAEKQIQNSQPKTFAQKAGSVLASSRISSSGQIMPLVGQLAGLAGDAAPALAIATAAMTAARALGELTASSAAVATSFNNFQNATGTSGMGAARLSGMGGSIGLSPDATASLSASLSEHLRSDPFAIAAGARMGLGPALNRPFDSVDEGDRLTKAIEGLRRISDPTERIRTARALGIEAALPIANQSESQYQFGRANDRITAGAMTPALNQNAADFNASQAEVARALENVKATFFAGPMENATRHNNELASFLNESLKDLNKISAQLFGDRNGKEIRHFSDHDAANDAMDKNSDALKANTQALTTLSGNFGSPGARLSSALPAGFNLQYLTQLLNNQSGVVLPPF